MQMSLDYGPIFKLSVGRKLLVVVSSPTLAKEILRDHDVTFANRNPSVAARTFSYGGKDIAFSPYGPEWRMLRKVFVQNMQSRKVLEASYLMRKDVLRKTVKELYRGGRIDDIVVGGTDTSSTTIEWVMSELILNPESMKRVQHELTEVIKPDSVVEESDISNLPFLHAVVKETLRLHPVAPLLLPRSPTESCHVGGYTIPEGAKVFLNVWAMHRDPDYWTNPSSFCPGRFVNEGLDYMGNNFHYLPFGSGRRFCAGFQLGEKMVMYVLATFLHMFDWEVPEDVVADTEEKFGVVLEKVTPLILIPSPRLSNPNFYCS
ncbi:Cytochrome P450 71AU50 [Linum grandiflorum]